MIQETCNISSVTKYLTYLYRIIEKLHMKIQYIQINNEIKYKLFVHLIAPIKMHYVDTRYKD